MSNKPLQLVPYAIFDKRSFGQEIVKELVEIIQPKPNWQENYIFEIQNTLPIPRRDISAEQVARSLNQINVVVSKTGIKAIKQFELIDYKTTHHQIALYLIDLAVNVRKSVIEKIADPDQKEQIDFSMFHLFECPVCLAMIFRLLGCFLLDLEGLDFGDWLRFWELVGDIQSGDFHQKIIDQRYTEGG